MSGRPSGHMQCKMWSWSLYGSTLTSDFQLTQKKKSFSEVEVPARQLWWLRPADPTLSSLKQENHCDSRAIECYRQIMSQKQKCHQADPKMRILSLLPHSLSPGPNVCPAVQTASDLCTSNSLVWSTPPWTSSLLNSTAASTPG